MVGRCLNSHGGRLEGMVFVDGKATTQMEIPELANHIGVVLSRLRYTTRNDDSS